MIARGTGFHRGNRQAGGARLSAHMKYLEYRALGEEESRESRHLFSEESDHVSRSEAVDDVMSHTSTSVNFHKLVLSPSDDEPVEDWREWTREIIDDLEERKGLELHWYAVYHENTDHPHVHVVVAGAGEREETEKLEPVKLYVEDYQFLRERGHEHSDHDLYVQIRETVQELDRQDDLAPAHPHTESQELAFDR
jgi:type IV secretory pathway VirD2 relaxase